MVIIPKKARTEYGFAKFMVQPNEEILFGGKMRVSFLLKYNTPHFQLLGLLPNSFKGSKFDLPFNSITIYFFTKGKDKLLILPSLHQKVKIVF